MTARRKVNGILNDLVSDDPTSQCEEENTEESLSDKESLDVGSPAKRQGLDFLSLSQDSGTSSRKGRDRDKASQDSQSQDPGTSSRKGRDRDKASQKSLTQPPVQNDKKNQVETKDLPEPIYQVDEEEKSDAEHQLEPESDTEHQLEPESDAKHQLEPYQETGAEHPLDPVQESHPNQSACKGFKRKRWTMEEENDLVKAFKVQIIEKRNASTEEIKCAINKYHNLKERSIAVIRSKINNKKQNVMFHSFNPQVLK